jgi:hypothetical protein
MRIVESLAKLASTLTDFASIGSVNNQSVKIPVGKSLGLISSLIRILKISLGYSGSDDTEVAVAVEPSPPSWLRLDAIRLVPDDCSDSLYGFPMLAIHDREINTVVEITRYLKERKVF